MEKLFETISRVMRSVRLTQDEKLAIKQRLIMEMRNNPVRKLSEHSLINWSHLLNVLTETKIKPMPAFLLILLLLGATGGTSALAEQALPGDILYPVKTGFNERIIDLLAVSANSQAEVDSKIAQRRLKEAEQLAEKLELNEHTQSRLIESFQKHANRVQDGTKEITAQNASRALEIISDFEASLQTHKQILTAISQGRDATTTELLNRFLSVLRSEHEDTKGQKEHSQNEVDKDKSPEMKTAAEGKLKSAENKIEEVTRYIENASSSQSTSGRVIKQEDVAEAQKRLQDARDLIAKGKLSFAAGNYGEAFSIFQEAKKTAQEAKLLIDAKMEFDDDRDVKEDEDNDDRDNGREDEDEPESSPRIHIEWDD